MDENGLSKIKNNEISSSVYDALLMELDKFAEFEVENKKSLLLNIVTDKQIESDRIKG